MAEERQLSTSCNTAEALDNFLELRITSHEQADFSVPSAGTMNQVMGFLLAMDRHHATGNRYRSIAVRIEPLVRFIERYSKAIDCLVQCTDGSVLSPIALIWGGLRVVLEIASSVTKYFPKLVDLLESLGATVSIYSRYNDLFSDNAHFRAALEEVYGQILNILLRARKTFKKKTRILLLRSVWATFESDFRDRLERLHRLMATLEQETTLAHRTTVQSALAGIQQPNEVQYGPLTLTGTQDTRRPVLEWLSPMDVSGQFYRLSQISTTGTGAWLPHDSIFQAWESSLTGSARLWIRGPPGVGKTILSTTIIRHLQEQHGAAGNHVLFHFCDGLRDDPEDEMSLFKSIIAQLCVQANILPSCLLQAFETAQRYGRRHITSADSPAVLLQSVLATSENNFLVIDGLDELKDASRVLKLVHECLLHASRLHVVVLSRDSANLRTTLASWPTITLGPLQTRADIEKYVSCAADALPVDDSVLKTTTVQRVLDRSDGMFLWARLAMDALSHATSPAHLLHLAEQVPQGVSAIYLGHLRSLLAKDSYTQGLAAKALRCIGCSKRPLNWTELQFALSHTLAVGEEGTVAVHTPFQRSLICLVYPLVVYEQGQDRFGFSHLSVREFLLRLPEIPVDAGCVQKFFIDEDVAASEFASACIACLNSTNDPNAPFGLYAALFWTSHVLDAPWTDKLQQAIDRFLSDESKRQTWLSQILFHHRPGFHLQNIIQQQGQLSRWMAARGDSAVSRSAPLVLDWTQDTLSVLLRNHTAPDADRAVDAMSYFEKLMIIRDLSRLLKQSNRTGNAIATLEQHREAHCSKDVDQSCIWMLNALGILYDQQGESAKSILLHEAALARQESAFGPDQLEPTWTVNELGRMYRHVGDYSRAVEHHLRALDVLRRVLPPDHLEIIWTENTLARAERKRGRPEVALELHTRAYEVRRMVLGELHPHTLWVLGDLAQCYRDLGQLQEAAQRHRSAMTGRTEALGPKHPDTLWSGNDLGAVLAEAGEHTEALALQSRILIQQSEVLGPDHDHTTWTRKEVDKLILARKLCT